MNEEDIFLEALQELNTADRAAYVDRACGENAALRRDIEALLQAHECSGDVLQRGIGALQTEMTLPQVTEHPGTIIGPYKLLEQIGEGGMGVVFMAEQSQPVRRKVALKVLKPGMDTRQVSARFEAERQALALMDHPHIAKVLDAGATESGRPYFVMELVRGIPITDYCEQSRLDTRARLQLFVDVCHSVQHAHQKGIIHRDLKPSNVLVTHIDGKPVVKVIDFGIAKATGQQLTDKTLYTAFAQMIGTPLYMSPEQAALSGVDVDTRSDVYSLGVMLYELLTGTTPFSKETFSNVSYDELRRIIREEEPPRPSVRFSTLHADAQSTISTRQPTDVPTFSRQLRGELDWIVMQALEKDRNRRYESASALAADVERYLCDEPVLACPPSVGYRLRKYVRKHSVLLSTGAIVIAALLAGTTISVWQANRAKAATAQANANELKAIDKEQEAQQQRHESERNLESAMDAVEKLLTHIGNPELAEIPEFQQFRLECLQDSLAFYERFHLSRGTSPRVQYRAAQVFGTLGELVRENRESSLFPQAIAAYTAAQRLADRLVQQEPGRRDYRELQAELYLLAGRFYMNLNVANDDYEQAVKYLEKSELLFDRMTLVEPSMADEYGAKRGDALVGLANIHRRRQAIPQALECARRAYDLTEQTIPNPSAARTLAVLLMDAEPEKAAALHRRAVAIVRMDETRKHRSRFQRAYELNQAAEFFVSRDAQEAEAYWRESLALLRELSREFPYVKKYSSYLGIVIRHLVRSLNSRGQTADAFDLLRDLDSELRERGVVQQLRAELLGQAEANSEPVSASQPENSQSR